MCFSATASFGSGVLLSTIGFASLKRAQTPTQYPFASIPLIFGVQQLAEGFVWLSLSEPVYENYQQTAVKIFLLIAQAVWPVFIPFAFMQLEPEIKRKRILTWLLAVGAVIVVFVLYFLFSRQITAEISEHHIKYHIGFPGFMAISGAVLYFFAVIVPPFISSVRHMKWLALGSFGAFVLASIFYTQYLVSVWCFFAAIVSVGVFLIVANSPSFKR